MDIHSPAPDDVSRLVATSDDEPCTVSVPEASELFAAAALPRTERAIQRFCKKGELKCAFVETPFGSKYLIARSSIDRLIVQKKQAQKFAPETTGRDLSGPDATSRDKPRQELPTATVDTLTVEPNHEPLQKVRSRDSEPRLVATEASETEERFRKLQDENLGLKIDNAGKQLFISQLINEREGLMTTAHDLSYRLGAAEAQVAQLTAPEPVTDASRPVATVPEEPMAPRESVGREVIKVDSTPTIPEAPAPEPRRPWWRR